MIQLEACTKSPNRYFTREDAEMVTATRKDVQYHLSLGEGRANPQASAISAE